MKLKESKNQKVMCPREGCKNQAIIDPTFGVLPCQKCQDEDSQINLPPAPEFYSISKQHRIQSQRDSHNADIIQPWANGKGQKPNPDFVRQYPEKAKNYFSNEELAKM